MVLELLSLLTYRLLAQSLDVSWLWKLSLDATQVFFGKDDSLQKFTVRLALVLMQQLCLLEI